MLKEKEKSSETAGREFVISREFNAPRNLVWKANTEKEHLANWWGPKGFTMKVSKLDLRPGGVFHYCMTSSEGKEMWAKFVYREIVAPEKIVFVNSFSDAQGGITPNPWLPVWPLETLNTIILTENNGMTTFTFKSKPINAKEEEMNSFYNALEGMKYGFKGAFDQLDEYLTKMKA